MSLSSNVNSLADRIADEFNTLRDEVFGVRTVSYASAITLDASVTETRIDITATGDIEFETPSNPNRRVLQVSVLASGGARTVTFDATLEVLTGIERSYPIPSGEVLRFSLEYSALKTAYVVTAVGMTGG